MSIHPAHRRSLPAFSVQRESFLDKSRSLSESVSTMERRGPSSTKVKRWDGAARSCTEWDNLRRDPELWFRGGNCFIHLYAKGQSQRGPAFKVPFGALLAAQCHPLLHRSISRDNAKLNALGIDEFADLDLWCEMNPTRRVDLFIPPPPTQDKTDAFNYHLATRNFFAWVFRRSLVAEHLGNALISLHNTMADFRNDEDHMADLLDYMDEEGYLGVDDHPNHALAVLHFAEVFRVRDAYIHAFCHCAGMSEHLPSSPEYYFISPGSKRLIRHNRLEMDLRISRAGRMLRTFLEDDLCEPFMSLPAGGRAHLDRFRSFLFTFYSSKFGYYPPQNVDGRDSMFEPRFYQIMHEDFRALYDFLVDETTTSGDDASDAAFGGVSVIQNVMAFDSRRRYMTLEHPFPLLPEITSSPTSRRQTWLFRGDKLTPDQRLIAYAALVRATNMRLGTLDNDLVRAYRKFEELSVAPATKVDRNEKISIGDARKVRWILIYSIYQVLRHCTEIPDEVSDIDVEYNLAVSTENLPPWQEEVQPQPPSDRGGSVLADVFFDDESVAELPEAEEATEIVPDVDYTAKFRREEELPQLTKTSHYSWSIVGGSASSQSPKSTHRSSSFSRTWSFLRKPEQSSHAETESSRRSSMYHEIVVHGYGNGTHAVTKASNTTYPPPLPELDTTVATAAAGYHRSPSTDSSKSYSSSVYSDAPSHISSEGTADSSVPASSPKTSTIEPVRLAPAATAPAPQAASTVPILSPIPVRSRRREVLSMVCSSELAAQTPRSKRPTVERRATMNDYAQVYQDLVREEKDRAELCPEPLQIRKAMSVSSASIHRAHDDEDEDDGLIFKCSGIKRAERCKSVAARSATWV